MSLFLVKNSANVVQLKNENNLETIKMLERLLEKARSGNMIGITGVFQSLDGAGGSFATGSVCERNFEAVHQLAQLQTKIQG